MPYENGNYEVSNKKISDFYVPNNSLFLEKTDPEQETFISNNDSNKKENLDQIVYLEDENQGSINLSARTKSILEPYKKLSAVDQTINDYGYFPLKLKQESDSDAESYINISTNNLKLNKRKQNFLKSISMNLKKNYLSFDDLELKRINNNINFDSERLVEILKEENNVLKQSFEPILKNLKLKNEDLKKEIRNLINDKESLNKKIIEFEDKKSKICPFYKKCKGNGNSLSTNGVSN